MDASISIERIREAAGVVDPVFLGTPQFVSDALSDRFGATTVLKVETVNPIRSFKGRGTSYLVHRLGPDVRRIVCASAGNFGQGMAYACGKRGITLTVFAARGANSLKLQRMRDLGATVVLEGTDFDEAKGAARRYADEEKSLFVEDGLIGAIGEGAGTIAVELLNAHPLDAVFVPVGNGSLVNGVGTWIKHASPQTRVIGVCARDAPAMALSWEVARPVEAPAASIADGIAVRLPIREAVEVSRTTVDEFVLVAEEEMLAALRWVFDDTGLVVEPAAAASIAAVASRASDYKLRLVAAILTGGNVTTEQARLWLH